MGCFMPGIEDGKMANLALPGTDVFSSRMLGLFLGKRRSKDCEPDRDEQDEEDSSHRILTGTSAILRSLSLDLSRYN